MPRPVAERARVPDIDALRGLALFGILMVNIWFFADSSTLGGGPDPATAAPADIAVRFGVVTFFEGKFYLLFSLLFGYGFVVLQAAAGRDFVQVSVRRFASLGVLGILHGLTLFYGDILLTYAVAGAMLLASRGITARAALGLAAAITVGVALLFIAAAILLIADGSAASRVLDPASPTRTASEALVQNARTYGVVLPSVVFFQGPLALAAFYAGSALARMGVLRPAAPPRRVLQRVVVLTLPLGLAASAGQAYLAVQGGTDDRLLGIGISVAASPLLTVGYATAFLLLLGTRAGGMVRSALAPAGQLALSNYIAQSALLCLIFTGYGLGLMDRLPAPAVVLLAVVLFAAQSVASRIILAGFRTGPLEWILRRVTYGGQRRRKPAGDAG